MAQLHGVGLAVGVGVGLTGTGVGGIGVGVGDGLGVGGIGVGDAVGVGVGDGLGLGDGEGLGEGVGQAATAMFDVIVIGAKPHIATYVPGFSRVRTLGTGLPSQGQTSTIGEVGAQTDAYLPGPIAICADAKAGNARIASSMMAFIVGPPRTKYETCPVRAD